MGAKSNATALVRAVTATARYARLGLASFRRASEKPPLSLALQGGGSFGAFTWGVLDRLLEEDRFAIDMVSGTSAGAINAALLADGLAEGGPPAARRRLDRFWNRVSSFSQFDQLGLGAAMAAELSTQLLSPYQFNPLGLNPLRDILAEEIDFARLRDRAPIRLLVGATRVKDGGLRLFRNEDLTLEAVLASSCLPQLHRAVEIDGESYWDGGFRANPPLGSLVKESRAEDVLVVQLIPREQKHQPRSPRDILRRMNQIAFNAALDHELEALADLSKFCRDSSPLCRSALCGKLARLRLHHIAAEQTIPELADSSALSLTTFFARRLNEAGRNAFDTMLPSILA